MEVFPAGPRKEDVFLHYMYVADSGAASAPQAGLTDSAEQSVVRITSNGRTLEVSFNKTGAPGGRVKILGAGVSVDQPLTSKIQPQRIDTEEIWK